jgi:flagellar motor switch protein FliN/FliY
MSDFQVTTDSPPASEASDVAIPADVTPGAAPSAAHDPVDYGPFESLAGPPTAAGGLDAELERLHDVPVELTVEIGRTRMTIGETLALGPGSIVSLQRLAGEPVDLLVNGKRIAYGEVVVIDEEFGLRITDLVESRGRPGGSPAGGLADA